MADERHRSDATGASEAIPASRRPSLIPPAAGVARLSRASHVPLYYQLAVILENRMEAGAYAAGERFPTEQELCDELGVSRAVVRPAIAMLEREGRLERIRGRGTFVRPPKMTHMFGGLTRVAAAGDQPRAQLKVIEVGDGEHDDGMKHVLTPSESGGVRRVTALLCEDDTPVALFWSLLTADVIWAADLDAGAVRTLDELETDLVLTEGTCVMETSWSTDFESACLDVPGGTPIMVAHCTETGGAAGAAPHILEVAWVMCRADSMRFRVHLGPAGE